MEDDARDQLRAQPWIAGEVSAERCSTIHLQLDPLNKFDRFSFHV
jgi:hypothetical protein